MSKVIRGIICIGIGIYMITWAFTWMPQASGIAVELIGYTTAAFGLSFIIIGAYILYPSSKATKSG